MVETFRDARGVRHRFVAGARALTLELHIDDRLNGVQTEALPAIFDLDVGQSEAVLQRPGHLQRHNVSIDCPGAVGEERLTLETCARRKTLLATSSCSAMAECLHRTMHKGNQRLIFSGGYRTAVADGETLWAEELR